MTRSALITFIKQEARVNASTDLDDLIAAVLDQVLIDICNKARYSELLKLDTTITLVAAQGAYLLPADYQNLAGVRYARAVGTNPTPSFQILRSFTPSCRRRSNWGLPEFFLLSAGPSLTVWPASAVLTTDQLLIDYYITPTSIFSGASDLFPVPRLESYAQKEVVKRVQGFHSDQPREMSSAAEANASFVAGRGGTG